MKKFEQVEVGDVGMSIITYGELLYGAQKSHHPKKTLLLLVELVSLIPPLPMSIQVSKHYDDVRSKLENKKS